MSNILKRHNSLSRALALSLAVGLGACSSESEPETYEPNIETTIFAQRDTTFHLPMHIALQEAYVDPSNRALYAAGSDRPYEAMLFVTAETAQPNTAARFSIWAACASTVALNLYSPELETNTTDLDNAVCADDGKLEASEANDIAEAFQRRVFAQ